MRAPLLAIVVFATVTGFIAACADATVPDDLDPANDSPAATAARSKDAGKGTAKPKAPAGSPVTDDDEPAPPGPGAPGGSGAGTDAGGGAGGGTTPKDAGGGGTPPKDAGKPPTTPPPAPTTPFKRLDIRHPVETGDYVLQCSLDAKSQLVWKSGPSGTDPDARFADPSAVQQPNVFAGCGSKVNGEYPLVFTSVAAGALPAGTYAVKCRSSTVGDVYRVSGSLEGHPSATFMYQENHPACAGQ